MDAQRNIYVDEAARIPAEDKLRVTLQIQDWYATLRAGGSVGAYNDANEFEKALIMATVRYLNGLGPDSTDSNGEVAMAEVREALAPLGPQPGRR